jgi:RHS repeat-associated protein
MLGSPPDCQVETPFGYTAQYQEAESGMLYLRGRYYDPATQQFISRDPLEASTGQPYAYACGNPVNYADPAGGLPTRGASQGLGGGLESGLPDTAYIGSTYQLSAGRPGSIVRNKLEKHEYSFAQEIVSFRGGVLEGNLKRRQPGIDGTLDSEPISLKTYLGYKLSGVLTDATRAERKAKNAQYRDLELFIEARNVPMDGLIEFASAGPLVEIPKQGIISAINVLTMDGWLRIGR